MYYGKGSTLMEKYTVEDEYINGKYAIEEGLSHLCTSVFYLMMVKWNDRSMS